MANTYYHDSKEKGEPLYSNFAPRRCLSRWWYATASERWNSNFQRPLHMHLDVFSPNEQCRIKLESTCFSLILQWSIKSLGSAESRRGWISRNMVKLRKSWRASSSQAQIQEETYPCFAQAARPQMACIIAYLSGDSHDKGSRISYWRRVKQPEASRQQSWPQWKTLPTVYS